MTADRLATNGDRPIPRICRQLGRALWVVLLAVVRELIVDLGAIKIERPM